MDIGIDTNQFIFLFSLLLITGVLATKFSYRFGVPALILFIALGMIVGSDGLGIIYFDNASLAQLFGILALIIILFEGGLQTKWDNIKQVAYPSLTLATLGVVLTAVFVGIAVKLILDVTWLEAFLFGAIVGSTDAAAVFAVLRGKNIQKKLESTLEAESGTNDPMAMFLTLSLIELIRLDQGNVLFLVPQFVWQMGVGLLLGYVIGKGAVWILRQIRLDSGGLYPVLGLGMAILGYGVTAIVGASGLLAVYILALVIGNADVPYRHAIFRFHEGFAWMMQILMFILLGLLVFPSEIIGTVMLKGLLISIILMFIARPLSVFISMVFFRYTFRENLFLAWSGLRGAVPIVLATYPLLAGLENSQLFFNVVFFVVLTSALIQGSTISPLAKKLGLVGPQQPSSPHSIELVSLGETNAEIVEYIVQKQDAIAGKRIREISFPEQVLITAIVRDNQVITPEGATVILEGDVLFVLVNKDQVEALKETLTRQKDTADHSADSK
ncbi:potassium/proton antiporter [Caldalkalibacillus thermarum TA2.A1]|uniref:Potassium/proton antiporter n=4 Tax=Caldalkalibacillus TaxID=379065 RepID=A0A8X8IBS7_CALTT|nr:potassium/proton antiporter [Caldalkalibacillus thermarum]QZT35368.1 potassium/proton antiporter [Caldalkalibacillus thermarum TA2.A1]